MRELKFRSWNEAEGCFYYFLNGGYFDEEGNTAKRYRFNWDNAEQYTGIKDKNRKETYEGDIVKAKGMKRTGEYVTTIIYEPPLFKLELNKTPLYDSYALSGVEIIGNIHENPDLHYA